MSAGSATVRRVVTGSRCEEVGCYEMGTWYVQMGFKSFHWCRRHLVLRMEDVAFWEERGALAKV